MERIAFIQLGLLLLALPAQYLISRYMASNEHTRGIAIRRLVFFVKGVHKKYLTWHSWRAWCLSLMGKLDAKRHNIVQPTMESPALEVLRFRNPHGLYGTSTTIRSPHPKNVRYRVGQVVRHKTLGYRAVIIGWDQIAQAPESWLKKMHPHDKQHWRSMANYLLLVDTRDRSSAQSTYVAEENLKAITDIKIQHPGLDEYFDDYDGAQYFPRSWLKTIYPHD